MKPLYSDYLTPTSNNNNNNSGRNAMDNNVVTLTHTVVKRETVTLGEFNIGQAYAVTEPTYNGERQVIALFTSKWDADTFITAMKTALGGIDYEVVNLRD